jgi:large subunit ribosomal protein L9
VTATKVVAAAVTATASAEMPQAILLQSVENVGEKGAVVDVSKGYLRNFLIPRKLAEPATKGSIAAAQQRQAAADKAVQEAEQRASDNAAVLNKTVLTISHQAGDDGRLFGSVTTEDLSDAIHAARGLRIDRRHIQLDDPIKTIGTHLVTVEVAPGVTATVKTMVVEQK